MRAITKTWHISDAQNVKTMCKESYVSNKITVYKNIDSANVFVKELINTKSKKWKLTKMEKFFH